jgi:ATP-dependent helicase HrpA
VLLAQKLAAPADLGDQLARSVFEHVFLAPDLPPVRTRPEFDARLASRRAQVVEAADAPIAALRRTLELRRALLARLESAPASWAAAVADVREQLTSLIYDGFVRETPIERLLELPRYLQAMSARVDKLRDALGRDAALAAQVRPYWQRWSALPEETRRLAASDSALARYRWMIEELRVSLFAQALGTRERVSPQRLEKQWESVRAELRA